MTDGRSNAAAAIDPDRLQRRASDPAASVWVGASAGSGKTKVLTDRVLRLLLSGTTAAAACSASPSPRRPRPRWRTA